MKIIFYPVPTEYSEISPMSTNGLSFVPLMEVDEHIEIQSKLPGADLKKQILLADAHSAFSAGTVMLIRGNHAWFLVVGCQEKPQTDVLQKMKDTLSFMDISAPLIAIDALNQKIPGAEAVFDVLASLYTSEKVKNINELLTSLRKVNS